MTMPSSGDLVTCLMDAVDPRPEEQGGLQVGHPVQLRPRPDGRTVEAWSPHLGRLGRLPPEEGEALAPHLLRGSGGDTVARLDGQVSALVPRPGRAGGTRIHIRVSGAAALL